MNRPTYLYKLKGNSEFSFSHEKRRRGRGKKKIRYYEINGKRRIVHSVSSVLVPTRNAMFCVETFGRVRKAEQRDRERVERRVPVVVPISWLFKADGTSGRHAWEIFGRAIESSGKHFFVETRLNESTTLGIIERSNQIVSLLFSF